MATPADTLKTQLATCLAQYGDISLQLKGLNAREKELATAIALLGEQIKAAEKAAEQTVAGLADSASDA